jgi:hypothetical protein
MNAPSSVLALSLLKLEERASTPQAWVRERPWPSLRRLCGVSPWTGGSDESACSVVRGVAVAALIAAGCSKHDVARPGDRTFDKETQPPGSAVAQSPPVAVVIPPPPQPVVVQPSQAPVVVQSPQAPVVVQPLPAPGQVVVVPPAPPGTVAGQVVQADALEANEVRAQTTESRPPRSEAPFIRAVE